MSDAVGNVSFYDSSGQSDYSFSKPYSEHTAELIDHEIKDLIDIQYQRARKILADNAEGHKKLAEKLLEREVIFSEDLEAIFGPRKWDAQKGPEKKMEVPMADNSQNEPLTSPPTTAQNDSPKDNKETA